MTYNLLLETSNNGNNKKLLALTVKYPQPNNIAHKISKPTATTASVTSTAHKEK